MFQVVGASAKGYNKQELQDNFCFSKRDNGDTIITVVCDGAGSKENSKKGAFIMSRLVLHFVKKYIEANDIEKIEAQQWDNDAKKIIIMCIGRLKKNAKKTNTRFDTLGSTLILNVYTKNRLLCANLGDGRGAYKNLKNRWLPTMVPFSGEEAGETVFTTTIGSDKYICTSVIEDDICCVVSLSDGMEKVSFRLTKEQNGKMEKANEPYEKFFDPLENYIKNFSKSTFELETIFEDFLQNGTERIENELDDKTMIIGVRK